MSTRLEQLQKMLQREPDDIFLLYGLAMEHKKAGQKEIALELLDRVTQLDAGHGYAFFQSGQIKEQSGDYAGARKAYEGGIAAAIRSGDAHAKSELESALSMLES